jgi:hypothetical protein
MPERAPCCREAGRGQLGQTEARGENTHGFAMTGDTVRVVAATLAAVGHRGELNYSINISIGGMDDLASDGGCGCLCGGSWGQNKGRLRWMLCVVARGLEPQTTKKVANRTRKRWYTASQCVCVSTSRGDSIKAVEGVDEREMITVWILQAHRNCSE